MFLAMKEDLFSFVIKKVCGHLGGSVSWASDFGLGHDLAVCEFELHIGLTAVSEEPALGPLSPSLSAPHMHVLSLKNKHWNQ